MKTKLINHLKCTLLFFIIFYFSIHTIKCYSQSVAINTTGAEANASAMLEIGTGTNDTKGLLIPRVALTAANSALPVISPAISLLVYNTATAGIFPDNVMPGFYYWSGSKWVNIPAPLNGQGTSGQVLMLDVAGTPTWTDPAVGTITDVSGTAPIVSSGGTTPVISINAATTSTDGSMSASDKAKLDGIATGAEVNATHTGDATGATALTVVGINGTTLSGLGTGILKNTTGTGVPSIATVTENSGALGAVTTLDMSGQLTNTNTTTSALNLTGNGAGISFTGTGPNQITTNSGVDLALMPGGIGNVGVGTSSPGAKLEINGNIKITGGNPGAGKVLTSDASGTASWGSGTSDFSGTGSDGALNVLSGTTTLNDASHITGDFAIYNYTTGSISAGAILTTGANFANKILVLKFTGDCNIAGTINTSGAGGTGGAKSTAGNLGARAILGSGQPSTGTNHITGGIGGSGGLYGYFDISNGSGGAGGSDGPWYSGGAPGGNGGQSVAIICKGTLTISGTINASGGAGTDAQNSPSSNTIDGGGSGGGGGGSGNILLVANAFSITAPTLNVNGGAAGYPSRALGGNGGSFPNTWTPGGAGGGASGKNAGSNGSNGNASCVCTGGNSGAGAVGSVFYCRYDSFYNLGF